MMAFGVRLPSSADMARQGGDAMIHLGQLELGIVAGDRDIAQAGERAAEADGAALHDADDRHGHAAEGAINGERRFRVAAPHVERGLERSGRAQGRRIAAEAEVVARSAQHDEPASGRRIDHGGNLGAHLVGDQVAAVRPVHRDGRQRPCRLAFDEIAHVVLPWWIARHTRSGVAGMVTSRTPYSRNASTIALMMAGGAPVVPPSPAPLTPSGLLGAGTSLFSLSKGGNMSARGIA